MALWAEFDIYHVERILLCKMQHLGEFWPVCLEDLLFPKKRQNLKRTFTIKIYSAKFLKNGPFRAPKVHRVRVKTPI